MSRYQNTAQMGVRLMFITMFTLTAMVLAYNGLKNWFFRIGLNGWVEFLSGSISLVASVLFFYMAIKIIKAIKRDSSGNNRQVDVSHINPFNRFDAEGGSH